MAQDTAGAPVLTWEQDILSGLSLPLPLAALLVWALAFGLYVAISALLGMPVMDWERGLRVPIDQGAWTAVVHSVLFSFGFVGVHYVITSYSGDIAALAPVSRRRNADELRRLWLSTL